MPTPDIGVMSGTPNTGIENSQVFSREVDPMLYFFETDLHPIATRILTSGQKLGYRENSVLPKLTGNPIKKQGTSNMKFEHFEDQVQLAEFYRPTAALTASATSLTVSSSDDDHFRAGDVLLLTNAGGQTERLVVTSVAANTLNVQNPDGTTRTAGIAMTTGDKFYRMENVRAEDSLAPSIRTTKRGGIYNYCEIISETYGLTFVKQATADYNGDPLAREKRKAFSRLLVNLEMMFLFGTRDLSGSTSNPQWSSGGLKYFMELYSDVEIRDAAGFALTRAELTHFLSSVGKGGSPNKVLLCDSRALAAINNMGFSDVRTDSYNQNSIGMNVRKIFGPFGEYELVYEPLFDQIDIYNGSMMVLDMDHIKYRYLEGNGKSFDIKEYPQILADGSISEKGQFMGMCGFQFSSMKTMGWMKNIGA